MKKLITFIAVIIPFLLSGQSFTSKASGVFRGENNRIAGQDYIRTMPFNTMGDTIYVFSEYGVVFQNKYIPMQRGIYGIYEKNELVSVYAYDVPSYVVDNDFELNFANTYAFSAADAALIFGIDVNSLEEVCSELYKRKDVGTYKSNNLSLGCGNDLLAIEYMFDATLVVKRQSSSDVQFSIYKKIETE